MRTSAPPDVVPIAAAMDDHRTARSLSRGSTLTQANSRSSAAAHAASAVVLPNPAGATMRISPGGLPMSVETQARPPKRIRSQLRRVGLHGLAQLRRAGVGRPQSGSDSAS